MFFLPGFYKTMDYKQEIKQDLLNIESLYRSGDYKNCILQSRRALLNNKKHKYHVHDKQIKDFMHSAFRQAYREDKFRSHLLHCIDKDVGDGIEIDMDDIYEVSRSSLWESNRSAKDVCLLTDLMLELNLYSSNEQEYAAKMRNRLEKSIELLNLHLHKT